MKVVGVILIATGLVLGPAYYIFSYFFSGGVVASSPIEMERRSAASEKQSARAALLRISEPVVIWLSPKMNPLRLILRVRCHWDTLLIGPVHNHYRATLARGDAIIFEHAFQIAAAGPDPGSQVYREVLTTIEIPTAEDYTFSLQETTQPEMTASDFQVEVRRHVRHPEMRIVVVGVLIFCIGLFALLL